MRGLLADWPAGVGGVTRPRLAAPSVSAGDRGRLQGRASCMYARKLSVLCRDFLVSLCGLHCSLLFVPKGRLFSGIRLW